MGWAKYAIEALQRGEAVQIRPRGHSMSGRVNDGDLVTLRPVPPESLFVSDVVLVRVHGNDYLHLIKAIDGERFQIGNNKGRINGWVRRNGIYGHAVKVEPFVPGMERMKAEEPEAAQDIEKPVSAKKAGARRKS